MNPRFRERGDFEPSKDYRLLPFRFGRLDEHRYVLTNDVGEHIVLQRSELECFVRRRLESSGPIYRALKTKHFLFDEDSECAIDLLALKYRSRASRISDFTGLHIFVVTLRCDHSCHYCQVSRQTEDKAAYDMTAVHAERALEFTFRTPSRQIKIEFQGGEPLLAFDRIRDIVLRAEAINARAKRDLAFVIATNLTRLNPEILDFCLEHRITLSTSLDGPRDLHDAHRPLRGGSSHAATLAGIERARAKLGHDAVSALMTTTPASLERAEEIIDEYMRNGFRSIFLRSLSPFGFAVRTSLVRRYDTRDWLAFYKRGLAHILSLNEQGTKFREEYTCLLLHKLFGTTGTGYVDLQSPAGIGIGAVVFNYDGAVYASDEGRMLAEMRDYSFRLGHLDDDAYEDMMGGELLFRTLEESLAESSPMCSECPFLPHCGSDPVFHKATQGDVVGHKAFSAFCAKQTGILQHLITLLEDDPRARRIMLGWI